MRFYTDTREFVFQDASQYPTSRPVEMYQVTDRTAGGTTHTETYARPISTRTLKFELMPESDMLGMMDWFVNVVNGMADSFNFEDERGDTSVVKFNAKKLSPTEVSYMRYSMSVGLEVQNA